MHEFPSCFISTTAMNTATKPIRSMPEFDSVKVIDSGPAPSADFALQAALLEGVSRTFALTIPQLPAALYPVVANAYLLCRIVDTIEDEVSLSPHLKRDFCRRFVEVVRRNADANDYAHELFPLLSEQTIPAEHELIRDIPKVLRITHGFDEAQQEALATCVETMATGMPLFQSMELRKGLQTVKDMDRYCYFVAGCVGEMLTRLFCVYSAEIAQQEQRMLELSVSFGQGLQMTNILKDIWDDQKRSVCWLPQEVFSEAGFDLGELAPFHDNPGFCKGLEVLIKIAHAHLKNALEYTLLVPKHEIGIRYFCLWALGMALLNLKKIKANLNFSCSEQVKISRRAVKSTILATKIAGRSDAALRTLFSLVSRGLEDDALPTRSMTNT